MNKVGEAVGDGIPYPHCEGRSNEGLNRMLEGCYDIHRHKVCIQVVATSSLSKKLDALGGYDFCSCQTEQDSQDDPYL
jgi:hypothetical protein